MEEAPSMNLKEQQYIVALADCGSFTRASSRLGVTQPALSAFLTGLERDLGHPLFDRSGKTLVPTYLGEIYLEKARKILDLGEQFDEQLDLVTHGYQGRLRVGIPIRRSPHIIPSALRIFQNAYPRVEIIFQEGNLSTLTRLLHADGLDIMLCNLANPLSDLETVLLYRDPVVFLAPASHPACRHARCRPDFCAPWIDLREFEGENFILQHEEQSMRRHADQILQEARLHPRRLTLIRNIETAAQMAACGLGVSFCLRSYIRHMNFPQAPAVFSVGSRQQAADFSAAWPAERALPEYALAFIGMLKDVTVLQR